MQNVSNEYKASMDAIGRNRAYIKIELGIVNSDAQESAVVDKGKNRMTRFSKPTAPFSGEVVDKVYATCEENFAKVDGSMFFLPKEESKAELYNNGIVTTELGGELLIEIKADVPQDIKGLTIDFGDCYPTVLEIENDTESRIYENNQRNFVTDDSFDSTTYIKIKPIAMVGGNDRLRVYSFTCGIAKTFGNAETKSYSGKEYVSPIADTLPSNDVQIVVYNYDQYYNPDNPDSALSYMTEGQQVKVTFGYDVTGKGDIEWLPSRISFLSSWKADDETATFNAVDRFTSMTDTYYKGMYRADGITLYDLCLDVLADCGITDASDYFLDSYLKDVVVYNPMPPVKHTEALQIIANAGRCALSEDRRGRIHIQSEFVPTMTVSSDDCAEFGSLENLLYDMPISAYADASRNFVALTDSQMKFVPNDSKDYIDVGFVSKQISDDDGNFDINPKITVDLESSYSPTKFYIDFRNIYATNFVVHLYNDNIEVQTIPVVNKSVSYVYDRHIEAFDKMEIEFTKTEPNQRIHVDSLIIGDKADYTLSRNKHLTKSPMVTREDTIKSIDVYRDNYLASDEIETLVQDKLVTDETETTRMVYFSDACYNLSANGINVDVEIIEQSNYYALLKFTSIMDNAQYEVLGKRYKVVEQVYSGKHNDKGVVKTWKNPLVSTEEHAKQLEEWLADFYLGDVSYELAWRGDARVDANDLMHLERKSGDYVRIRAYENTLNFAGAWSGMLKTRKVLK